ncbi:MAG: hypothetical protein AAGA30_08195 [Planctomycetota bacterium]
MKFSLRTLFAYAFCMAFLINAIQLSVRQQSVLADIAQIEKEEEEALSKLVANSNVETELQNVVRRNQVLSAAVDKAERTFERFVETELRLAIKPSMISLKEKPEFYRTGFHDATWVHIPADQPCTLEVRFEDVESSDLQGSEGKFEFTEPVSIPLSAGESLIRFGFDRIKKLKSDKASVWIAQLEINDEVKFERDFFALEGSGSSSGGIDLRDQVDFSSERKLIPTILRFRPMNSRNRLSLSIQRVENGDQQ